MFKSNLYQPTTTHLPISGDGSQAKKHKKKVKIKKDKNGKVEKIVKIVKYACVYVWLCGCVCRDCEHYQACVCVCARPRARVCGVRVYVRVDHLTEFSRSSLRNAFQDKHESIAGFEEEIATWVRVLDAKLTQATANTKAKANGQDCMQDKSGDEANAAEQKVGGKWSVIVCVHLRWSLTFGLVVYHVHFVLKPNKPNRIPHHTLSLIPHRCRQAF